MKILGSNVVAEEVSVIAKSAEAAVERLLGPGLGRSAGGRERAQVYVANPHHRRTMIRFYEQMTA